MPKLLVLERVYLEDQNKSFSVYANSDFENECWRLTITD
jgi:hypothetical protein